MARHGEGRRRFTGDLHSRSKGPDSGPIQLLRLLHGKAKLHKVQLGLRHSRAKPGHGAVAAQRWRPVTGLLGDLRTTGARAKRKRRSGRGSPGVESDGGATQTSRRRAQAEAHGRSSGRRRCDGAPSVGTPGFDSWTHQDPSTVALVGWRVVERRFCAGAEARRGGARRSGMEAALGFMAARLSELVGVEAAGQFKGWAGILGRRAVGARRDPRREVRAAVALRGRWTWRVGPRRQRL